MAEATFRRGQYRTLNYTPGAGNVAAGDVVLLGNTAGLTCGIAHHDILNTVQGSLAVGGGDYDVINLNNAANYDKVYWDGSKVTTVSTNMALFGYIVEGGGGGANSTCLARHHPYA